jgi:putative transposase
LVLGCNRSSTYRISSFVSKDKKLLEQIQAIKLDNPWYGLGRLKTSLKLEYDSVVNIKKLRRICNSNNIIAKTRIRRTPKRDQNLPDLNPQYPNRIKEIFDIKYTHISGQTKLLATKDHRNIEEKLRPNYIWASDFTYLKYQNQMYYLSTNIDIFSKEITGFGLSTVHSVKLIKDSLVQGIKAYGKPAITHSDQGSEYRSQQYQDLLNINKIECSMSSKSSPWENGFQESFYNNFKLELELQNLPKNLNFTQIYNYIVNQIDYYNNKRIHTSINNTPTKFRLEWNTTNQKQKQKQKQKQNTKPTETRPIPQNQFIPQNI